ncbi:MAG: hypothetical protein JST12_14400 [Armatimonadetes bacterium]|nr:hypothetical protein [Armatimonadota bacterium]
MSRQDPLSLQRVHNEPGICRKLQTENMLSTKIIALLERTPIDTIRHDVDSCAERLREHLIPIAVSIVPDLPPDLREDVVQETLIAAICGPSRLDPERGSPERYLRVLMHTAANKVRRSYALPGNKALRTYVPAVSLDAKQSADGQEPSSLGETLPSGERFEALVHDVEVARYLIDLAVGTAPVEVADALQLVYDDEHTITAAAEQVGVNRITLRRRLDAWAEGQLSGEVAALVA